jgi:hypothetical protein
MITDDKLVALVKHKFETVPGEDRIYWLGMGDEALADPRVCAPYQGHCRRVLETEWRRLWSVDLDEVRDLFIHGHIDGDTYDDAFIDVTTTFESHMVRRLNALAKCAAILNISALKEIL